MSKFWSKTRDHLRAIFDEHSADAVAHSDALLHVETAIAAPPPKSEALQAIDSIVDGLGEPWCTNAADPLALVRQLAAGRVPDALLLLPVTWPALAALLAPAFKEGLRARVERTQYIAGLPQKEREKLVAELREQIREIEERSTARVNMAEEVSIRLPLLASVADQRRAAEIEAEQRAARERDFKGSKRLLGP